MTQEGTQPEVTLVVPCYNHSHYLLECLESIRAQTWTSWKVIVVDDFSPDHEALPPILEQLGDSRISLIRHERNRGLGASRNTGITAAESEFVYPLDADDKIEPDCLESLMSVITKEDDLDCIFGDVRLFGRVKGVITFPGPGPGKLVLRSEDTIPGAGTLLRKSFWERAGKYDEAEVLKHGREDFEFWIRAFSQGCTYRRVPKPLYLYRQSHSSMNITCRLEDHQVIGYLYEKHKDVFPSHQEAQEFLAGGFATSARAAAQRGLRSQALTMARKAWAITHSREMFDLALEQTLPPALVWRMRTGELRRRIPFLGLPKAGPQRHRPFFIVGVARSGNTLFRRVLTSHSGLHIPPEVFVLGDIFKKWETYNKSVAWPDLVYLILAQFELHHEYHTIDTWLGPIAGQLASVPHSQRNLATIINGFFRYHAQEAGKPQARWGDKTPLNSLYPETLEGIAQTFPDAQFLHIHRDGMDVVYSHLSGGFYREVEDAAVRWRDVIRNSLALTRKYPERSHTLSYEDLVSQPEATIRGVCEFLGVGYEPQMATSSEVNSAYLGDIPEWFWHEEAQKPISSRNVGKGRKNFTPEEKRLIQSIMGADLEALGYPPATD